MSRNEQSIFGIRAIIEAIKAGKTIDKIILQAGLKGELLGELRHLCKELELPLQMVPEVWFKKFGQKNHQGAIAFISPIEFQRTEDLIPKIFEEGRVPFLIMLDRVTDVRNFGAICRTASGSGADAVIIPSRGAAQIGEDAIKTSAGALFTLPVCREENLKLTLHYLKQCGVSIVAVSEKTEKIYTQTELDQPVCLLLGSEENGISPEYLKLADQRAKIPMLGKVESLNVSVAAGILMYEVIRQRS